MSLAPCGVAARSRKTASAFTLVELLMVLAIISMVLALLKPISSHLLVAFNLTQAGEKVSANLNLARQQALTLNRPVEVRFYKYADDVGTNRFWALQIFAVDSDGNCKPLNKIEKLPQSILMDAGTALSPLLGETFRKNWTEDDPQPKLAQTDTYDCRFFRYYPDGSTSLPSRPDSDDQSWYLTLHAVTNGDNLTTPPANYLTLQVDRGNGTVTTYRP